MKTKIVVIAYAVDDAGKDALDAITDEGHQYLFVDGEDFDLTMWRVETIENGETQDDATVRALKEAALRI